MGSSFSKTPHFYIIDIEYINIGSVFSFKWLYNNNVSYFGVYHKVLSFSIHYMLKEAVKKVT